LICRPLGGKDSGSYVLVAKTVRPGESLAVEFHGEPLPFNLETAVGRFEWLASDCIADGY